MRASRTNHMHKKIVLLVTGLFHGVEEDVACSVVGFMKIITIFASQDDFFNGAAPFGSLPSLPLSRDIFARTGSSAH